MSLALLLRKEAGRMAANLRKGLPGVIEEKKRLKRSQSRSRHVERLASLTRDEHAGLSGPVRLAAYKPDMMKSPDCPYCWMLDGKHMSLVPDFESPGTVACPHCGGRYIEWL